MSLSSTAITFLSNFWYLIPLAILVVIFKTPWFKGVFGEFIVNFIGKRSLNQKEYHIVKNVTLPTDDGTTQIDHVIVSPYGVFVVETKNMKGWIFGSVNDRIWTQKIYRHSSKFQNPLHQNYKHVATLKSLLGLSDSQIQSLVVFVGDSKFKTPMPDNVTHGMGYIRFIKSRTEPVLSELEVRDILNRIESGRLKPSLKTRKEHIEHVKKSSGTRKTPSHAPSAAVPWQ